jgi:protein NrfD
MLEVPARRHPRKPPSKRSREVTYYDQPALKPAPWDWKVPVYTFVAPVAGAMQVLATVADLTKMRRGRRVVRNGRFAALLGAVLGGPLLIGDLHTPKRWYNMLRIFRSTSPMSIGSWLLMAFGGLSALVAAAQAGLERNVATPFARGLASLAQIPAALAGAGMAMYSASLFTATSSPLWAAAPRSLAVKFGSSAVAAAAAGLSLAEQLRGSGASNTAPLDHVAAAATAVNLAATITADQAYRRDGVEDPLSDEPRIAAGYKLGSILLGQVLPLACYAINATRLQPSRELSAVASLGVICGSYLMRHSIIEAGKVSSRRPKDAFRFARRRQKRRRIPLGSD